MDNPYMPGKNRFYIAEQAIAGKTKSETYTALRPMVESQTLVFKRNATSAEKAMGITHRQPHATIGRQLIELQNEIGRTWKAMGLSKGQRYNSPERDTPAPSPTPDFTPPFDHTPEETPDEIPTPEIEEEEIPEEDTPETPEAPIAKGKRKMRAEMAYFLRRVREIRATLADRKRLGETVVDSISNRPAEAASKLIPEGIPADALLHTMAIHWGPDSRQSLGISDFDMESLSSDIMRKQGITEIVRKDGTVEPPHEMFGYVWTLAKVRQPIALKGEMGTGKSWLLGQLADYLDVDYAETPMSLGATRGDLLGRFTASPDRPFIPAKFVEIYGNGGVFNFEELDAADPGLLIVLNNALAGQRLYNSNSGQMVNRSENFIGAATMNTWGYGADTEYNGREALDWATLDRWRMGRCLIRHDESVEDFIAYRTMNKLGISE